MTIADNDMERACFCCERSYTTQGHHAKSGSLKAHRHTSCSVWCMQDKHNWPSGFNPARNAKLTVPLFLAERGRIVIATSLTLTRSRDVGSKSTYFLGHYFAVTSSPTEAVSEFIDQVSRAWFYTPDEQAALTLRLFEFAFDHRFGATA